MLFIAEIIANLFGVSIIKAEKYAKIAVFIMILLIIMAFFSFFKFCGKKNEPAIFTPAAVEKVNSNIESRRNHALEEILVANDLIEAKVDERTRADNQKLKAAEEKVEAAKKINAKISASELMRILEETK